MSDIRIVYSGLTSKAELHCTTTATEKQSAVKMDYFKGVSATPLAHTTLERNRWLLNGTFTAYPYDTDDITTSYEKQDEDIFDSPAIVGYISNQVSSNTANADGYYPFTTPITITRTFETRQATKGLTIDFDKFDNAWSPKIKIQWYYSSSTSVLREEYFTPNSSTYFCDCPVGNDDDETTRFLIQKITFYGMNKPNRYLRLFEFKDNEVLSLSKDSKYKLLSVKINVQATPLSIKVDSSELEFDVDCGDNERLNLKTGQQLDCYVENQFFGTFYVDTCTRSGINRTEIKAIDIMSWLADNNYICSPYIGFESSSSSPALTIAQWFEREFDDANADVKLNIPVFYYVDPMYTSQKLNGSLSDTSYKSTLQKLANAMGLTVIPTGQRGIEIIDHTINRNTVNITDAITYEGLKDESSEYVTNIQLSYSTYTLPYYSYKRVNSNSELLIEFSEWSRISAFDPKVPNGTVLSMGSSHYKYMIVAVRSDGSNYDGRCYCISSYDTETEPDMVKIEHYNNDPRKLKIISNNITWNTDTYSFFVYGSNLNNMGRSTATLDLEVPYGLPAKSVTLKTNDLLYTEQLRNNLLQRSADYYNSKYINAQWVWNGERLLDRVTIKDNDGNPITGTLTKQSMEWYGNKIKVDGKVMING